jgi:hypothetical protein
MAYYEWVCKDCKLIWEREYDMGKAPDRTRCPECSKLSERHFDGSINVSWGDDMDFHTHRSRVKKVQEKGWDKTAADRWLKNRIEDHKKSSTDESFRYKAANINWGKMAQDGLAREVTGEERTKVLNERKKLTEDAYNRANKMGYRQADGSNLDITKPRKQS